MVERHLHDDIRIAHVAAEFRVSRPTITIWVARYRTEGHPGLQDRPSRPHTATSQLDPYFIVLIEGLRRDRKRSARRIHHHLRAEGHQLHLRTVGRWLHRLGISRLRDLPPAGEQLRRPPQRIRTSRPGHMVRLDVKKLGRIPDGGGWRAHGRGSQAALSSKRQGRVGYTYLHSAIDGHTRLAYTEVLPDGKARTRIGFFARARVFFAARGITSRSGWSRTTEVTTAPPTSPGWRSRWRAGISGSAHTRLGITARSSATTG